jgi:hypothetical protein
VTAATVLELVDDERDLHVSVHSDEGQTRQPGRSCGVDGCGDTGAYSPIRWVVVSHTSALSFEHDDPTASCADREPPHRTAIATDTPLCPRHLAVTVAAGLGLVP